MVGETDPCTRSTASAARSLAWSISASGAVEPNTVYVATPLCKTSSTTSHVPGKRPWILSPGFGTADTHRISEESGVINARQTFGSRDTASVFDPAKPSPAPRGLRFSTTGVGMGPPGAEPEIFEVQNLVK